MYNCCMCNPLVTIDTIIERSVYSTDWRLYPEMSYSSSQQQQDNKANSIDIKTCVASVAMQQASQ